MALAPQRQMLRCVGFAGESRTVDSITEEIVRDIETGVGDTGVRSGIIGEVGCSWPWTDNEKKSVAAAVAAQRETGAPLMIHPGRDQHALIEIARFIEREGGDLGRTVMSHVDIRIYEREILRDLAATGIYIEYDTFGLDAHRRGDGIALGKAAVGRVGNLADSLDA